MEGPRLAANLKWLFGEWPLPERFAAAAACGFRAVELSLPYELPLPRLRGLLQEHALSFVYLLASPGDWNGGERGLACVPGREREFRDGMREAIRYAQALGRPLIHAAAGIRPDGADPGECDAVLSANLRWACEAAAAQGLHVVVEPVCRHDYPQYSINTVDEALALIEQVGAPNLGVVFDLHHVQWEHGFAPEDVHRALRRALPKLRHIQLALAPSRDGPRDGGYDVHATLSEAQRLGYQGFASCEYRPGGGTLASLGWARQYGIAAPASSWEKTE